MIENQVSFTAKGVAVHRALESERPLEKRICDDPYARKFVGDGFTACGEIFTPQWFALWLFQMNFPGFHDYLIARTRHFDEYLLRGLSNGVEQVVILGAGYDSRAYRMDQLKPPVKVFEVDHPATQRDKVEKLKRILGEVPRHSVYVALDFNGHSSADVLFDQGYDNTLKTVFLMEGMSYYLKPETVDSLFAFIRRQSGDGSSIIFDYTFPEVIEGNSLQREAMNWRVSVRDIGEKLLFGVEKKKMADFLALRGFLQTHSADHIWLEQTYFTGENQGRSITPIFVISIAETGILS